ncbi:hypothetical protein VPH35_112151 [Triticum aestivum]
MTLPSSWPENLLAPIVAGPRATCSSWGAVPSPPPPPWSELPHDLLGLIVAGLPDPADRARFSSVCRSWRSVPCPYQRQLPWIDAVCQNLRCIGSTDSWLALDWTHGEERHAYFLHNPFSRETVPLPELDAVIGDVSEFFMIRKVLMRSTPDDPIVRGKGALLPQPQMNGGVIIDVAFLGDKLWGITMDGELIWLPITFDDLDGIPMATSIEQVIWSNIDNADAADDDEDEDGNNKCYVRDGQNNGEAEKDSDELLSDEGRAKRPNHIMMLKARDGMVGHGIQVEVDSMIFRYLVESCGKLLMVIREANMRFTCKVEVFVVDFNAGAWVPISEGGLGGQTLFISKLFSKSVLARGEVEPNAICFVDFGEVFCMKSSQARRIGHFRRETISSLQYHNVDLSSTLNKFMH